MAAKNIQELNNITKKFNAKKAITNKVASKAKSQSKAQVHREARADSKGKSLHLAMGRRKEDRVKNETLHQKAWAPTPGANPAHDTPWPNQKHSLATSQPK